MKEANTRTENGFLSIEKVDEAIVVVFRMDTGRVTFRGRVTQVIAKFKKLTPEDDPPLTDEEQRDSKEGRGVHRLKFVVAVRSHS